VLPFLILRQRLPFLWAFLIFVKF